MYVESKTVENIEKNTWIDLRLWQLFDLCQLESGRVDCIHILSEWWLDMIQNYPPKKVIFWVMSLLKSVYLFFVCLPTL